MVKFCEDNGLKGDHRNHIYLMPFEMVREYAIGDAVDPIDIFKIQWNIMKKEELIHIYEMEMENYPLLLQMRRVGVRVDKQKVHEGIFHLKKGIKFGREKLFNKYGKFNYNSSPQLARVMDEMGIMYPLTEKGNPNLDKAVLESMDSDLSKEVVTLKEMDKILGTFFINSFSNHMVNGRIHCNFYPLRTGEYGTVSGRFSSADPNLQQIPSKEETFGQMCRRVFIPEEDCYWSKKDYSQIEYRIISHYAIGPKSEEVRALYNNNPDTDYHQLIMDWTGLNRKDAKVMNFGMAFAMGARTLAKKYGWPYDKALQYIQMYNQEVPFVKATRQRVTQIARGRGHIKTILGRRSRVTDEMREMRKEYVMFNRLIQGSAADLLKKAMHDAYYAGIYNVLIPHLTVHDELDQSVPNTKEGREADAELTNIMENCIKLKVPIKVDSEIGPSWGDLKAS
jgi:DNA polymerase I-like protein with 3'-5' exonuclease and polymerase domains